MATFTYPSPEFPADPSVSFEAPAGWVASSAPGTRLAITMEVADGSLRPSVALLISRHSAGYPSTEVLAELEKLADDLEDGRLEDAFEVDIDGHAFTGRVLVYRNAEVGTLAELHMITSVEHDGVTDVLHLVGTCAGSRAEEHLPLVRDVIATVRIADQP